MLPPRQRRRSQTGRVDHHAGQGSYIERTTTLAFLVSVIRVSSYLTRPKSYPVTASTLSPCHRRACHRHTHHYIPRGVDRLLRVRQKEIRLAGPLSSTLFRGRLRHIPQVASPLLRLFILSFNNTSSLRPFLSLSLLLSSFQRFGRDRPHQSGPDLIASVAGVSTPQDTATVVDEYSDN